MSTEAAKKVLIPRKAGGMETVVGWVKPGQGPMQQVARISA